MIPLEPYELAVRREHGLDLLVQSFQQLMASNGHGEGEIREVLNPLLAETKMIPMIVKLSFLLLSEPWEGETREAKEAP